MLRLPTEFCVQKSYLQYVHVAAVCKISSAEDECLRKDLRSASPGTDKTNRHKVFRGPLPGTVNFRATSRELLHSYRSRAETLAPFWLSSVLPVGDLHSQVLQVKLPISQRRCSNCCKRQASGTSRP
jgi:hypothetical protein